MADWEGISAGKACPNIGPFTIGAAAVACDSARIGDGRSTYFDGVLSRVNRTAEAAGARPGMAARRFVTLLGGASDA